jgi:hypothetical protein
MRLTRSFTFGLFFVSGVFTLITVHLDSRRRELSRNLVQVREEAESLTRKRSLAAQKIQASERVPTDLEGERVEKIRRARLEIAALDQRARVRRAEILAQSAQRIAGANPTTDNRDPIRGMTKLEYFRNVGRDTPSNALQTLVWAALKGEESTVVQGVALDASARAHAEKLIADLPENTTPQRSPEQLAALWFESAVLDVHAAQIIREELHDATHATVLMAGGIGDSATLDLVRSPAGWQLVVPGRGLETIQKRVIGEPAP